jgi:HAD superfamily hydrolase (TIGR01450 family)
MTGIPTTTIEALRVRYSALLLDAYGVLVHGDGVMPGAPELIRDLDRDDTDYLVVTNDASRLPETAARRYRALGLEIPAERIVTSGSLLLPHFHRHGLSGRRCAVLGPRDSAIYVERAGGHVVAPDQAFDVLVICDESGVEPFVEVIDAALTTLLRQLDAGVDMELLLPNPDLLYPRGGSALGITSGAIAALFDAVLAQRYPERPELRFRPLGKPHTALFTEASRRLGTRDLVMIGDQLATDIHGANQAGIDSALFTGGLSGTAVARDGPRPTYLLESLGRHGAR